MKTWKHLVVAAAVGTFAAAASADNAVEAKALLTAAHAELASKGMTAAAADFNAGGKWRKGRAYVVIADFNGTVLAHADNPKLVGKVMYEAKDASGKPFVQETIKNVKASGESLIEYRWANPATQKIDNGRLMARKVPGQEAYVAVGFWE